MYYFTNYVIIYFFVFSFNNIIFIYMSNRFHITSERVRIVYITNNKNRDVLENDQITNTQSIGNQVVSQEVSNNKVDNHDQKNDNALMNNNQNDRMDSESQRFIQNIESSEKREKILIIFASIIVTLCVTLIILIISGKWWTVFFIFPLFCLMLAGCCTLINEST